MKSFKQFIAEENNAIVIYPGRFHPFHKGHAAVYKHLLKHFNKVFIATSDKVEPPKSPFSFEDKRKMMTFAGVPDSAIVQVKSPYQAKEITDRYNDGETVVIYAVSKKDMDEDPRFTFNPKKDGSPSYFQPLKGQEVLEPLDKHGYIMTVPTFNFKVLGEPAKSATEIRQQFAAADEETQKKIIQDLYGDYSPEIHELFKKI